MLLVRAGASVEVVDLAAGGRRRVQAAAGGGGGGGCGAEADREQDQPPAGHLRQAPQRPAQEGVRPVRAVRRRGRAHHLFIFSNLGNLYEFCSTQRQLAGWHARRESWGLKGNGELAALVLAQCWGFKASERRRRRWRATRCRRNRRRRWSAGAAASPVTRDCGGRVWFEVLTKIWGSTEERSQCRRCYWLLGAG
uniref:Uncharacterized protein n=1 Tax=Setaria viridis TaxID=4556 RepID=A0A4V6D3H0_SETVI|nr:hypothetical protein SEVIR_8G255750v2 [Setaria viridis]